MNVAPLISVIVPVYNVEKWLSKCVESICHQTYTNLEIILVDDGSTDSSGVICDKYEQQDERIQVIHKTNGGLSDARNAGFAKSTGDYVSFIDSDDWIEPRFYEFLFRTMQDGGYDIVGCDYRKCVEGYDVEVVSEEFAIDSYDGTEAMKALIGNKIQQVVWNKLYCRSAIDGIDFAKGKYHEDEFWSYQVFGRIQKYARISYIGYNYFQRADSIMGEHYSLKRLDVIRAKEERQCYLQEHMPELATNGKINLIYACLYHGQLALNELTGDERNEAFTYLRRVVRSHKIKANDLKGLSLTHQIWLRLSQVNFVLTCRLRNRCGVGM